MEFYENEESGLLRRIIGWMTDIVVVIVFACFTVYAFGMQVPITGGSMQPLLDTGNVALVNRLAYDLKGPERGDVVAFERSDGKLSVKRVAGLPGETVQVIDGVLNIDGVPVQEELPAVTPAGAAEHPIQLAENEYFLLGDNRSVSEDSRFVNVGNVKREDIVGRVWLRLLPLLEIGLID